MTERSPRSSWIDGLIALIERIAGPAWVFYVVLSLIFGVASIVLRWWDGSVPYPEVLWVPAAFATAALYPLAVIHYLNGSARRALADFRPALGDLEPQYPQLERRLTTMGQPAAIVAVVLGAGVQSYGLIASNGTWGVDARTSLLTTVFTIVVQVLVNVFFAAFILRAIRQLGTIVRIHRESTGIRLYEPGPHNAFSRFTLATAVAVTVPYALVEILVALISTSSPIEIALLVLAGIVSVVVFALPLNGMHRRLVAEKDRQLTESGRRFATVAARVHEQVDAGRADEADGLDKQLSALGLENDRLRRISTWPWSPDTLRGFVSALGVPLVLFVLTTLLSRLI